MTTSNAVPEPANALRRYSVIAPKIALGPELKIGELKMRQAAFVFEALTACEVLAVDVIGVSVTSIRLNDAPVALEQLVLRKNDRVSVFVAGDESQRIEQLWTVSLTVQGPFGPPMQDAQLIQVETPYLPWPPRRAAAPQVAQPAPQPPPAPPVPKGPVEVPIGTVNPTVAQAIFDQHFTQRGAPVQQPSSSPGSSAPGSAGTGTPPASSPACPQAPPLAASEFGMPDWMAQENSRGGG